MVHRALTFLVLISLVRPASAQQRVIDSGTLIVSRGGVAVGREEFTVQGGRSAAPEGYTIAVRSYYPATRGEPLLTPVVELGPDSQPTSAHIVERNGEQRRVFVQIDDRRVTVRTMTAAGESVRQYPGGNGILIADDSALSLYAVPPAASPSVGQIWPRAPRRVVTRVTDLGTEAVEVSGSRRTLRHVVLRSGRAEHHLWYDGQGRLIKVEVPGENLSAVRASSP